MNIEKITIPVGSNPITIETGKLAKLADGAVQVQSGETVLEDPTSDRQCP